MVTNKFGKIAGPGAQATPAANSVTSGKILDGEVATADIAAKAVTAAKLAADVVGAGLAGADGAEITVSLNGLSAQTVAVANDSIAFIDATDDGTYKESIADFVTGVADGTTIAASSGRVGVKASSLGIAQMANDDSASIFYVFGDHDFGQTAAKDTDLGVLGAKGTLIGGYMVLTEVLDGTNASHTITISSAATGGTPLATAITITKANTADGQSNIVGATRAFAPLAAGTDVASTAHIYVYTGADGTRTTGIAKIVLMFQKSA
jgi:hypothetical protein